MSIILLWSLVLRPRSAQRNIATDNNNLWLVITGVGPLEDLERMYKHGLVYNGMAYWVENNEVGKDLHDHTLSTMTLKVPNVEDFAFR